MAEMYYYYCQKCKKAVSNKLLKCDTPECRKTFRNAPTYTLAQIEEMIKSSENEGEKSDADELMMKCPVCGKRYSVRESVCQCGMPLVMDVISENIINGFGQPDIRLGQVVENICWKLKVRRYRHQRICQEAEINIDRTVFSLGRIYIVENNIFSDDRRSIQQEIINVSGRNALILIEDGKLYLRMDDKYDTKPVEEKSPVYLNGEKIEAGENIRLHPGNKILMGHYSKETRNLCLEYELVEIENKAYEYNKEDLIDIIRDELSDVREGLATIDKRAQDIDKKTIKIIENTDKIGNEIEMLSKLQIENFADIKSYMNAWQKKTDSLSDKTDEEYLDLYFTNYGEYKEIYNCLSNVQKEVLLSSAKMEYLIGIGNLEQYGGAFLDLCIIVEDFLAKTVSKILERYVGNESIREKNGQMALVKEQLKKASAIGSYTHIFAYTNNKGPRYSELGKLLFDRLFDALYKNVNNENVKREKMNKIQKTFLKLEQFRVIRNSVCHSDKENIDKDKLIFFTRDKYEEAKKLVFEDSFITEIYGYYIKLF